MVFAMLCMNNMYSFVFTSPSLISHYATICNLPLFHLKTYIYITGFTVRGGREAKFEKRWADRSSRLASLEGFKYFHLMRRVGLDDEVNSGKNNSMVMVLVLFLMYSYVCALGVFGLNVCFQMGGDNYSCALQTLMTNVWCVLI